LKDSTYILKSFVNFSSYKNLGKYVRKHQIQIFFNLQCGINATKASVLCRRCYCHIIATISVIEYTSMLADIWHQTGPLNCLFWIILTDVDCSFHLPVWLVWFGLVLSALVCSHP
jgi:hypothetical protein